MIDRRIAVIVLAWLLAACSAPRPAPIEDRARSARDPESATRTVVRGDTLYSIAWEAGRDYRELAAWNNISPPYTLHPGQQLRLLPPDGFAASPAGKRAQALTARPAVPGKGESSAGPAQTRPPGADNEPVAAPERKPAPAPATKPKTAAVPRGEAAPAAGSGGWIWPAPGPLLARYSDSGNNKGIDIGGAAGQAVVAAAAGRVVYQGSGLRGYGQLIIVKHSDEFLSAYAHNDRIYVKEGDTVKRGQRIAAMGRTGADRVKLHFEIRRNGIPVDPLKYLPRK